MTGRVIYGNKEAQETKANGVDGVLCKKAGGGYFFRAQTADGQFADYELRHDDLKVTIALDELASFYTRSDANFLDHSSSVLNLKII